MKLAYAIENIRRIRDLPDIELLPLTVLVGRNSAGKSTFLRTLPLIRQSIETRTSAPILWFGDLVDFGDLNVAIGESTERKQAAFRFSIRDLTGRPRPLYSIYGYFRRTTIEVSTLSIRYTIGAGQDGTVLQTIELTIPDEDIEVLIDLGTKERSASSRLTINGRPATFLQKYDLRTTSSNLFSAPRLLLRSAEREETPFLGRWRPTPFEEALHTTFSRRAKRKLSPTTIRKEIRRLLSSDGFGSAEVQGLMEATPTMTFKEMYADLLSGNSPDFRDEVYGIQRLARVFQVFEVIEVELTRYFLSVGYLEPVRAASERFYRKQELEISNIAPNGSNLPIFLDSLPAEQLHDFSEWVKQIFGFGVRVEKSVGHISIHLTSEGRSVNIADTGYGVSQILPVLGIVWWTQQNMRNPNNLPRGSAVQTLVIEQPELHLHPAHQAKLADAFVAAVAQEHQPEQKAGLSLMIETHSEALINRLGELIEDGKINADCVQVVVFSARDDLGSPTEISVSRFDDQGILSSWPFGFFNYSE